MKPYYIIIAVLLLGATACTKNFEKYNTDNTGISTGQLKPDYNDVGIYLLQAERSIINFSGGGDPNSYQVQQNLNADIFSGYFMSPNPFNGGLNNSNYFMMTGWNGEAMKVGYLNIMSPISKLRANRTDTAYPAVWAVAQIIQIAGMSRVTDIYGPIPYSKAGASKSDIPYDSQEEIYKRFFLELDTATANLQNFINKGETLPFSFANFDMVYSGDFTKWLQFANSLRLRLALHIVKADEATAKAQAEKALNPANGGVITANSGNMAVRVGGSFTNPLVYIDRNWADTRIGADIACYLNGYNDPRISAYLGKSTDKTITSQYIGIRSGAVTGSNIKDDYIGYSALGSAFSLTTPIQIMTAAEVYFLQAEVALRGWANAGGSAQEMYNQGVTTSMNQWNVAIGNYLSDATSTPAAYVDPKFPANDKAAQSAITIKWDDAALFDVKMERLITQKWIAMFPEGQEAWTEHRRTGYPKLFPVAHNQSGGVVKDDEGVRRLPYPQQEYNTNATELKKGISLLGDADNAATRVWWDKK
ncbi:RagB/SusD family nutrient uptake outer membrane protein [Chitinophaga sancti]|uniref:RagB/SusD family nutrient uptake outer membrane protein n=1 Tax=Chitinophaga sancti TaxID=1004 RepID=A0A1K1SRA2_9BACT|nr:RagB/SusD family nutrient uptake outer membrane protein [Chitinophaga sancti]WQD65330.1 RagB/SusD family nutrient uptake outer membrane protein [Chitinophaga sancti]WQG89046.1 RagB/SusD family nutrient uptake outer membrane protein [Chitinophaga sancti]SFW86851.1 Susd and RagB outer membrane lipoprotein [Chitinophaga sancti]